MGRTITHSPRRDTSGDLLEGNKMKVTLNETEYKLAQYISKKRQDKNRKEIPDKRISGASSMEIELEGVLGELAFCKINNIYPNTDVLTIDIWDAVLPNGATVDVKTTKYKSGRLLAARWKKEKELPDYYALMIGTYPEYELIGYMACTELLTDEHLKDLGRGLGYVAEQHELKYRGVDEQL